MWRYPGWLAFVAALLLSAAPAKVDAVQTDVRGNWQSNLDCDLTATASVFWLLDEDIESGGITASYTGCGTFGVPGAIREPSSCVFPSPLVGQVDGTDFELPASGFFPSDSHSTIQPFPFLTCSAASRIVSSHHLSGTITADDNGLGVRLGGMWENGHG